MPMPGTRAAGPGLRAVINRCCDVAATRQADPADNRAEQGTRALFAHYLESRSMFAGSSPVLTPGACRGDPCPEAWRVRWRGPARRARSALETDRVEIQAAGKYRLHVAGSVSRSQRTARANHRSRRRWRCDVLPLLPAAHSGLWEPRD